MLDKNVDYFLEELDRRIKYFKGRILGDAKWIESDTKELLNRLENYEDDKMILNSLGEYQSMPHSADLNIAVFSSLLEVRKTYLSYQKQLKE